MASNSDVTGTESPITFRSVFWTKEAYRHVAHEFYPCHSKDLNLILHIIGAGVQMWGVVQLLLLYNLHFIVYGFMAYVALTCPLATGILHSVWFGWFLSVPLPAYMGVIQINQLTIENPAIPCFLAIACGFLKDVGHHICHEPPFMGNYLKTKPYMFFFHATWHLPFLIDAYSPFSTVKPVNSKKL